MLAYSDLLLALPSQPVQPFVGILYRAIHYSTLHGLHLVQPPTPDPLFSGGAPVHGARFTPAGGMPSLYLAEDRATADREANFPYLLLAGANPQAVPGPPATVLFTAQVHLTTLLDVSDSIVQTALGTNPAELAAAWRTLQMRGQPVPTQELGRAVFDTGTAQAIRYPSAVPGGGHCFVVYPDRLAPTGSVEIYDPGSRFANRRIP
ncbi:MAG: RES domain-containing protein [Armatimonadetes bacterium]|nr:RES domain-containing protein [Armatimonadota bacterium]